jgi:hypothetical protein
MPGTLSALRLIELTAISLCQALGEPATRLRQTVSAQPGDAGAAANDAVRALISQLQLRRAAWGPTGDPVSLKQIAGLAHGLPHHVGLDLSALHATTAFSPALGRIVLNILLLAADSLPAGGGIILAGATDDLFVRIVGKGAAWPHGMALLLADEAEARNALIEGRSLQMALTALLARAAGIRLSALFPPASQSEPAILRLGG